jgi:hypothetical protein
LVTAAVRQVAATGSNRTAVACKLARCLSDPRRRDPAPTS